MVAVAGVEVAVEGLLLGQALGGVGADGGADVAEDGRGSRPASWAPASTLARAPAANSGVIQLKKTPSNSAPARAHIFGPIAARTRRTPGSFSRSSGSDSRIRVSGFSEKPAPTPSQRRAGIEAEPLDVGGDRLRRRAVEGDHGDAEVERRAPRRRTRPASPVLWRRDGRSTTSSRSRAPRSARPAAAPLGVEPGGYSEAPLPSSRREAYADFRADRDLPTNSTTDNKFLPIWGMANGPKDEWRIWKDSGREIASINDDIRGLRRELHLNFVR